MFLFSLFKRKDAKKGEDSLRQDSLSPRTYNNVKASETTMDPSYEILYEFEYAYLPHFMERDSVASVAFARKLNASFFLNLSDMLFEARDMENPLKAEHFLIEYAWAEHDTLICCIDITYPVELVLCHALIYIVKKEGDHLTYKLFFVENDPFEQLPFIGTMIDAGRANFGMAGPDKDQIVAKVLEIFNEQ